MSDIFISHVEEDSEIALKIALGLEKAGYTTWCYEVDSLPGPSYLIQTGKAVEQAKAIVVIISPHSIGSRQVTKEIVRAHEDGKDFIPVRREISHVEFQNRQPEWREAIGAASSIEVTDSSLEDVMYRIVDGIKALNINPASENDHNHIEQISKTLNKLQEYGLPDSAKVPPAASVSPKDEFVVTKTEKTTRNDGTRWYKNWIWLTLIAFVIIAAIIIGVILTNHSEPTSPDDGITNMPDTPVTLADENITETPETPVTFADEDLQSVISEAIHKITGPIYTSDLESLISLNAQGRNISNLTGIENCINLQVLHIYENNITDVSPLAQLKNLRELYIYKNNINDVSPLAGLTELEQLWLGYNNISDIYPLQGLTKLRELRLLYNNVSDIRPLVENYGLADGDVIILVGNQLSATSVSTYIPQLEQRGVIIILR